VTFTKWRGSTVSRSDWTTTLPAVKNWLTVSTTRRVRLRLTSDSSMKPKARPEKLTSMWCALQKRSRVNSPTVSGWSLRITHT